jgi:hypothetical protein
VFEHHFVEAETAGDRGDLEQAKEAHGKSRLAATGG